MQTVASLRSSRTESRKIADDVVSTTRTLSGLSTCVERSSQRQLLVGGDVIASEAFVQAPLTEANTASVPSMQVVSFLELFDRKLVLWCMQTTL
jgi:hypothetical protein